MNYRSLEDVARDLNLSVKAVRRYVASGELRAVKMKNVYKISEEDFEAFKKATLSTLPVYEPICSEIQFTRNRQNRKKKRRGRRVRRSNGRKSRGFGKSRPFRKERSSICFAAPEV